MEKTNCSIFRTIFQSIFAFVATNSCKAGNEILFGLVDIDPTDFFEWSSAVHTRGHPYKLFKNFSSNRARSTFFSERVVNVWNHLPHGIANFSSLGVFKRSIQLVDFSEFLKCY